VGLLRRRIAAADPGDTLHVRLGEERVPVCLDAVTKVTLQRASTGEEEVLHSRSQPCGEQRSGVRPCAGHAAMHWAGAYVRAGEWGSQCSERAGCAASGQLRAVPPQNSTVAKVPTRSKPTLRYTANAAAL